MKKCRDVHNEPSRGQRLFWATLEAKTPKGWMGQRRKQLFQQKYTASNWIDASDMQSSSSSSSSDCFSSFTKDFKDIGALEIHEISTLNRSRGAWPVWLIQFKPVSEAANLLAIDPSTRWPTVRAERERSSSYFIAPVVAVARAAGAVALLTACRLIGECKFRRLPRKHRFISFATRFTILYIISIIASSWIVS